MDETISVIRSLPLRADDIIYFSPIVEIAGTTYSHKMNKNGNLPLAEMEITAQKEQMLAGFHFSPTAKPKVATYDMNDFIY